MSLTTSKDLVSIIVPCFNCEEFVLEAFQSVFRQTHPNWEIIAVVDPNSNSATWQKVEGVLSGRHSTKIIPADKPGAAAARNTGLEQARGDYLCFLDADDVWLPNKLTTQLAALKEQDASLCATGFRRMDRSGQKLGRIHKMPRAIDYNRLLKQNCICISSVMLDRRRISEIRFRNIGCEDFAYWLDILKAGHTCLGMPQTLVHYRIHKQSRGSSKLKTAKESWAILRNELPAQPLKRSCLFSQLLFRGAVKYLVF